MRILNVMMKSKILSLVVLTLALPIASFASSELTVKAVNKLPIARMSQTIELTAKDLAPLGEKDLNKIHVADSSGPSVVVLRVSKAYVPLPIG